MDIQERFWSKVNKQTDSGCWEWTAFRNQGYGRFRVNMGPKINKMVNAHRWSWEQVNGPIPDGLQLDHLCRNRACVNPDHLEIVTSEENIRRGMWPAGVIQRTGLCKNGHVFSGSNIKIKRGKRTCRLCDRASRRRHAKPQHGKRNEYFRQRRALKKAAQLA